jgi:hypothetical protein
MDAAVIHIFSEVVRGVSKSPGLRMISLNLGISVLLLVLIAALPLPTPSRGPILSAPVEQSAS